MIDELKLQEKVLQEKVDKIVTGLKSKIEASAVSVLDFEITKLPTSECEISFAKVHFPTQKSYEIENFIVEINRTIFRVEKDIGKILKFDDKDLEDFTKKSARAIPAALTDELSRFKDKLPSGKSKKLHLMLPEKVVEIFSCKDRSNRRYVFDMVVCFGAYAEVDGEIFTYKYESDYCEPDLLITSEERILISNVINFVELEKDYLLNPRFNPEGYANGVLNRFKRLAPTAVLIFGDEPTDKKEYVRCRTDNTWEFSLLEPYISFEIRTNGVIHAGDSRYVETLPETR